MSGDVGARRAGWPEAVLVLTVAGYPLVTAVSVLTSLPNRMLSIGMRGLLVALAADVVLRRFLARGRLPWSPFWIAWWGFWALYIARLVLDGVLAPQLQRLQLYEYLLWGVGLCLVAGSAQAGGISESALRRALPAIIVAGGFAIAVNLWFIARNGAVASIIALAGGRASTDALNPISLGHLGVTVLILSLWRMIRRVRGGVLEAAALAAVGVVSAVALLIASSRGPLVAFLAVLPLLFARDGGATRGSRLLRGARLAVPVAALLAAVWWAWQNRDMLYAFRRVSDGLFHDSARAELLAGALDLILRNPLTGAGTEPLGTYPHNVIVEAFLACGVLGGLLFVAILAMGVRGAWRVLRAQPSLDWPVLLFAQALTASMFSGSLYESGGLWVLTALMAAQAERLGVEECGAPPAGEFARTAPSAA